MELLIGAAIYALIIQKLWAAARTDHELAKQGIVSPRMQARHGPDAAAKVEAYGFTDYLRDVWHDFWGRRGDALVAAREGAAQQAATPGAKTSFWERLKAAKAAIDAFFAKLWASSAVRAVIDPIDTDGSAGSEKPKPDTPPTPDDLPEGTRRYTGDNWEEYRGGKWQPLPDPSAGATPEPEPTATPAGGTVTAPTGEVVNFASAIAEIDALINLVQLQHDQASAAMRALQLVDNAIDGMQGRQNQMATAVQSLSDHLVALHLDAGSLGPVMDASDVLSAGAVDEMLEHLERTQAIIRKVIATCDAAIAALRAARSSLVAKYADAAATVEENLGGDSRFLSGDNAAAAPAPVPAGT